MEMAAVNKILGCFDLGSIPISPRGVPEIEVINNIEANGIVQVNNQDKATGKQMSVTITNSEGLSQTQIDDMLKQKDQMKQDSQKRKVISLSQDFFNSN